MIFNVSHTRANQRQMLVVKGMMEITFNGNVVDDELAIKSAMKEIDKVEASGKVQL